MTLPANAALAPMVDFHGSAAPRPNLVLDGVWARDKAAAKGVTRGGVADLRLHREVGLLAILGNADDGTVALSEVLAGQRKPDRGRVTIAGQEPHRAAALRSRMGVVGPTPALAPSRTVLGSIELGLLARGELARDPADVLRASGAAALAARKLASLSFAEARGIEVALALSQSDPLALVLFEPFTEVSGVDPEWVLDRIHAFSPSAVVCVLTASPSDAKKIVRPRSPHERAAPQADLLVVLHRGAFARALAPSGGMVAVAHAETSVWIASGLRAFADVLSKRDDVSGLAWEAGTFGGGNDSGTVRVRGADPIVVALAIADAATAAEAHVSGIAELEPTLAEVRTATESLRHAAYVAHHASRMAGAGAVRVEPSSQHRPISPAVHHPLPSESPPEPDRGSVDAVDTTPGDDR